MQKPFEDLIVLDLSRYLLGAYTSLFFADLGAQVIKVEDTKTGDLVRGEMPIVNGGSCRCPCRKLSPWSIQAIKDRLRNTPSH